MEPTPQQPSRTAAIPNWALAAGIAVFLGLTVLFGRLAADPFESGSGLASGGEPGDFFDALFADQTAGEDAAPLRAGRIASCSVACEKIVECGLLPDPSLCVPWCIDEWSAERQVCIAGAACDRIEETCFEKTENQICADVCARVSGCGWLRLPASECVAVCLDQWTREERDCLMASDCESALAHCLNVDERTPCPQVCDKLFSCGQFAQEDFPDCVRMCEEEMGAAERDCIVIYACTQVASVCVEGRLPEDLCLEACDIVIDCDLAATTGQDCVRDCEEVWSEDLALCVIDNRACEDATECFAEPGVQCPEFCAFLIECSELAEPEYEPCVASCPGEFSDEERQCVMAADCETVRDCLEPIKQGPDRRAGCADACSKLAGCRVIEMTAQLDCVQTCADGWSDVQMNCVLNGTCDTVGRDCMTQPQTSPRP